MGRKARQRRHHILLIALERFVAVPVRRKSDELRPGPSEGLREDLLGWDMVGRAVAAQTQAAEIADSF